MSLVRRVQQLERQRQTTALHACVVYHPDGRTIVHVYPGVEDGASVERTPYEEYACRWPGHPPLKGYLAEADGTCWIDGV